MPATIKDLYPTRVDTLPEMLPRTDPVVHKGGTGTLSDAELRSYARNGFVQLDGFYNRAEATTIRNELNRLRGSEKIRQSELSSTEPLTGETRGIWGAQAVSELFTRLCHDRDIVEIAEQLLGSKVYLHQTQVNFKPGFRGREFYWHSDFETWHAEDGMPGMRAVTCAIYLTEGSALNGPLMLIPGSHMHFMQCVGLTPEEHYKASLNRKEHAAPTDEHIAQAVEENGIKVIEGSVGSIVFFDCNILHGSNSNITPFERKNIFLSYNSVENKLEAPFATNAERPWYLANRDATPIIPCEFKMTED